MTAATDTQPQHMQALASANRIRLARAEERRRLRHTRYPDCLAAVAELLHNPPEHVLTMTLEDLLCACHYVQGFTAQLRILQPARVSPRRKIANLTPGERGRLLARLEVVRKGYWRAGANGKRVR